MLLREKIATWRNLKFLVQWRRGPCWEDIAVKLGGFGQDIGIATAQGCVVLSFELLSKCNQTLAFMTQSCCLRLG